MVHILDVEYPVKGDFDPGYIQQIAADLDHKMREMAKHLPGKPTEKTAVLTALNLESDLSAEKQRNQWLISVLEKRTRKIILRIEEAIRNSK